MGSQLHIVGRSGQVLPSEAIEQLKVTVKCEVLLKGEASEDAYLTAIDRFNKATIQEAVSNLSSLSNLLLTTCRLSSYSASPTKMFRRALNMSRNGIWKW